MWQAFFRVPEIGELFSDHIHPNDAGYRIMADTFFEAITRSRATSASQPIALAHARAGRFPLFVPRDPWDSPSVQPR